MNVVLYGATGKAGSRILHELVSRGHQVIAAVRNPSGVSPMPGVTVRQDDLSDVAKSAEIMQGADAVVSAYGPPADNPGALAGAVRLLTAAARQAEAKRLVMVGGAGSSEVAPGMSLINSGYVPASFLPLATAHAEAYLLLQRSETTWTYFSPAAIFEPGERTGVFRLGTDELISDASGESRISMEDFAIALVDELESPKHLRARFSIGY